jgi:hypothetical protein
LRGAPGVRKLVEHPGTAGIAVDLELGRLRPATLDELLEDVLRGHAANDPQRA